MKNPPELDLMPVAWMTMRDYIAVHSEVSLEGYNDYMLEKITGRPNPASKGTPNAGSLEYVAWLMEAEAKLCYMRADAFMKAKLCSGS